MEPYNACPEYDAEEENAQEAYIDDLLGLVLNV
jgi:hypothetical protein